MDSFIDSPPCQYVVIKRSGMDGKRMQLELNSESVFGSDVDCDVRIRHNSVAAQHARVLVNKNGQVSVVSLIDDAPVALNDSNVEQMTVVKDNDILTVGDRQFRFEYHRKVLSQVNRCVSKTPESKKSTPRRASAPRPSPTQQDVDHVDDVPYIGQENSPDLPEDMQPDLAPRSPGKVLAKSPSVPSAGRVTCSPSRSTTSPSRMPASSPSRSSTTSPSRRSTSSPSRRSTSSPSRKSVSSPSRRSTSSPSRKSVSSPSRRSTSSPAREMVVVPTPDSGKPAPACEIRDMAVLKQDLPFVELLAQTNGGGGSCPCTPDMKSSSRKKTTPSTAPAKVSKPAKCTASPKSLNWSSFDCMDSPANLMDASTDRQSPAVVRSAKKLGPNESLLIQQVENSAAKVTAKGLRRVSSPFPRGLRSSGFIPTIKSTPNSSISGSRNQTPVPVSVGDSFRSRRSSCTASTSLLVSIQEMGETPSPAAKMATPTNVLFQESACAKTRSASKRKSVTFGPQLSPELFDKGLPPNTPIRRGKNPNLQQSGGRRSSRNSVARFSTGVLGESLGIVEEEDTSGSESCTTGSDSQYEIGEQSPNYSTIAHCPSPAALSLTMPDYQQEEEDDVYYESDFEEVSEFMEEALDEEEDTVPEAKRTLPTPIRRGIEAKPALRKTKKAMPTPIRVEIKQRPKLRSRRNRMPTPLRHAIEDRPALRQVLRRMQTPLRREIQANHALRKIKQSLPTPLRKDIERKPQLQATKRSMPTPLRKEIVNPPALRKTRHAMPTPVRREIESGVELKQTRVQKSMSTPLRKEIESGVELRKTRKAAPTPLRKEIESGVELRKTRKAAPTPLRMEIESGVELRKTRKAAPTPLRKEIESGVELRKARKAAPTPLRKEIESGVELRKTRKAAPTPLRKEIESGVELRKARKAAPTPLRKEIESGVELRKTKRALHTPLKVAIQQGKQLRKTKKSLPTALRAEIEAQPQLRRTKRSISAALKKEIESQPALKKTQLPARSKMPVQSRKRRVSSSEEEVLTAKRRRVAPSHQKNTVMDDTELDGLPALFATPKPAQRPFNPSNFVVTPDHVLGRVKFVSPVSKTAQKKTPSGAAAPKILKAVPMELPSDDVFIFTAEPVKATRQRKGKKTVESVKASRKVPARSTRSAAKARPSEEEVSSGRQTRSGKRKAADSDATLPKRKTRAASEPEAKVPQPVTKRSTRHTKTAVSEPVAEETTRNTRKKAANVVQPEAVQAPCDVTVRRSTRGKTTTLMDAPLELPVTKRQTRSKNQSMVTEVPTVNKGETPTPTEEVPATRRTRSQLVVTEVVAAPVVAASTRSTRQRKAAPVTSDEAAPVVPASTRSTRQRKAVPVLIDEAAPVVLASTRSTRQRKAVTSDEAPAAKRTRSKQTPVEEELPPKVKRGTSTTTTPLVRRSARLSRK